MAGINDTPQIINNIIEKVVALCSNTKSKKLAKNRPVKIKALINISLIVFKSYLIESFMLTSPICLYTIASHKLTLVPVIG